MLDLLKIPFRQAKHFKVRDLNNPRRIVGICLHSMESQEKPDTAETVAAWFQRGPTNASGPVITSPHYCVDSNSIIQCVQTKDVAFTAGRTGNTHFIHIELAGRARQTQAEWLDAYGQSMLAVTADLCAALMRKFGLRNTWLSPADLLALRDTDWGVGGGGLTSHANISKAYKESTHWDPGPHFPVDHFLGLIRKRLS